MRSNAALMETAQKILSAETLPRKLAIWRFQEKRIVFTNGVFDLLHLGHIDYLERARNLGDVLLIGLNEDASVKRLKPGRPVQDQTARARCLAALQCVDAVVLFGEDTPQALIETVRPAVLVKGADYTVEQIVGADFVLSYGGTVQPIALVEGYSTTAIIQKIKALK